MQRIINHRKLLNVSPDANLEELKVTYRSLMKEWHPDKFLEGDERRLEAELKSKAIIEAYHFLVSVSKETHAINAEQYERNIASGVNDFLYKGQTLKMTFHDGSVYEYFGVPKNVYNKLLSSTTITRFGKRHIFHSYVYRNLTKAAVAV